MTERDIALHFICGQLFKNHKLMAGFGIVWAAIVVIVATPLLGGLLTIIALVLTDTQLKYRKRERKYASIAKESSFSDYFATISTKRGSSGQSSLKSKEALVLERKNKTKNIRKQIKRIHQEMELINEEFDEKFSD